MADHRTNEQWDALITDVDRQLLVSEEAQSIPDVASGAFLKTIDHTLLKLDATDAQFDTLCAEARQYEFATVCVRPEHVARCVAALAGSSVEVASVIGFHEGTYSLAHKAKESALALASAATELDVVLNYADLHRGAYAAVAAELAALRQQAPAATLKLIVETSRLAARRELVAACVLAGAVGFDFVKTSTGFHGRGADVAHVRVMGACCGLLADWGLGPVGGGRTRMRVKASGGVRSLADAVSMLEAGAARLGTSAGVAIAREARGGQGGREEGKEGEY